MGKKVVDENRTCPNNERNKDAPERIRPALSGIISLCKFRKERDRRHHDQSDDEPEGYSDVQAVQNDAS